MYEQADAKRAHQKVNDYCCCCDGYVFDHLELLNLALMIRSANFISEALVALDKEGDDGGDTDEGHVEEEQ